MSGFFGIFSPTGSIDLGSFEQMRKASESEGFDGMETIVGEHIAMGHLMLRVSPESKYDKQPLKSSCGKYILVGHFRLDYRDELGDKLGLTQSELEITPDSVLVMMAYQKWKEKCVDHLEGDWAFALYDLPNNSLTFLKDKTGISCIFFSNQLNSFFFSSNLKWIKAVKEIDSIISKKQFVRLLTPGMLFERGRTIYQNIFILEHGYYLKIDPSFDKVFVKYWQPTLDKKILFDDINDYIFEFKSLLALSIKSRLNRSGDAAIFLSSGFDSSTVAALVSENLQPRNGVLYSYTSIPCHHATDNGLSNDLIDESHFVKEFIKNHLNIDPSFLDFKDREVLSDFIISTNDHVYHPIITINNFWLHGISEKISERKIKRVFCGQFGNYTYSWNGPSVISERLLKGDFLFLLKSIKWIKKNEKKSIYSILRLYVLPTIFKKFLYPIKKNISMLSGHFFVQRSKALTPGFKPNAFAPFDGSITDSKKMRLEIFNYSLMPAYSYWYAISQQYGFEMTDPFSDRYVSEFSFSIPEYLFNYHGNKRFAAKSILESTMHSIPLNLNNRIPQSADIADRVTDEEKMFTNIIDTLMKNEQVQEFVSIEGLTELFQVVKDKQLSLMERRRATSELFYMLSICSIVESNTSKIH